MTRPRILAMVVCFAAPVAAHGADDVAARSLAATCSSCHGTQGNSVAPEIPPLAGMPRDRIVSEMRAFKDGKRPATVMHELARGYTARQIDLVAAYFAGQKK